MGDRRNKKTGCPVIAKALAGLRRAHPSPRGSWYRWSAADVADEIGVSRAALSAYENAGRGIPRPQLTALGKFYGVEFKGVEYKPSAHHCWPIAKAGSGFKVIPVDRRVATPIGQDGSSAVDGIATGRI